MGSDYVQEAIIVLTSILLPLIFVVFSVIRYNKNKKKKDIEAKYLQREQELRELREEERESRKQEKLNFGMFLIGLLDLVKKKNPDFDVKGFSLHYKQQFANHDFEGKAEFFVVLDDLENPTFEKQEMISSSDY